MKKSANISKIQVELKEVNQNIDNDLIPVRKIQVHKEEEVDNVAPMYLKQDPFMKHQGLEPFAA